MPQSLASLGVRPTLPFPLHCAQTHNILESEAAETILIGLRGIGAASDTCALAGGDTARGKYSGLRTCLCSYFAPGRPRSPLYRWLPNAGTGSICRFTGDDIPRDSALGAPRIPTSLLPILTSLVTFGGDTLDELEPGLTLDTARGIDTR